MPIGGALFVNMTDSRRPAVPVQYTFHQELQFWTVRLQSWDTKQAWNTQKTQQLKNELDKIDRWVSTNELLKESKDNHAQEFIALRNHCNDLKERLKRIEVQFPIPLKSELKADTNQSTVVNKTGPRMETKKSPVTKSAAQKSGAPQALACKKTACNQDYAGEGIELSTVFNHSRNLEAKYVNKSNAISKTVKAADEKEALIRPVLSIAFLFFKTS